MKKYQLNQYFMLAEVVLRKSCGSCGSSKNNPMESITYLRKLVAEVVPISRKGKCREALLQSRASLSRNSEGGSPA